MNNYKKQQHNHVAYSSDYSFVFGKVQKRSLYLKQWNDRWAWLRAPYCEILYYKSKPKSLDSAIRAPYGRVDLHGYKTEPYRASKSNLRAIILRHKKKEDIYLQFEQDEFATWLQGFQACLYPNQQNIIVKDRGRRRTKESKNNVLDIHRAAFRGSYDDVIKCLDAGVDINKQDQFGNTALHIAVMLGHHKIIELLVQRNASTILRNSAKWTALNEATSRGDREIIKMLWSVREDSIKQFAKERGSVLLSHFKNVGDFYLQLEWKFSSWLPIVSQLCPSDTWRIWKKGCNVRIDTHIMGFEFPRWKKGNLTFLFRLIDMNNDVVLVDDNNDVDKVLYPSYPSTPIASSLSSSVAIPSHASTPISSKIPMNNNKEQARILRSDTVINLHSDSNPAFMKNGHRISHSSSNLMDGMNKDIKHLSLFDSDIEAMDVESMWLLSVALDHNLNTFTILHEAPNGRLLEQRNETNTDMDKDDNKSEIDIEDEKNESIEDDVDLIMCSEMSYVQLNKRLKFIVQKQKIIGRYRCVCYKIDGCEMEILKRREHLSLEQIKANKEILESVRNPTKLSATVKKLEEGSNNNNSKDVSLVSSSSSRSHISVILARGDKKHEQSRKPPVYPDDFITENEYFSHSLHQFFIHPPHLGREMTLKVKRKSFQPKVSMTKDFPLELSVFISLLELASSQLPHVVIIKEFLENDLPPGFPVHFRIPIFPTISVTLSVVNFAFKDIPDNAFEIPNHYKHDPTQFKFTDDKNMVDDD